MIKKYGGLFFGSAANSGEFLLSLVIVFTAVFNLNCSLVLNSSLSFMFFHRVKEPKRPSPAKLVTTAFCSRVTSDIPRLAVVCH